MWKRIKRLAVISLSMIFIGVLSMTIALFAGGLKDWVSDASESFNYVSNLTHKITESIPFLPNLQNIQGFSMGINEGKLFFNVNDEYETYEGKYSFSQAASMEKVNKLNLNIWDGQVIIKPSDTDFYQIESTGNTRFQYYVEDDTLFLMTFSSTVKQTDESKKDQIILYIPSKEQLEEVSFYFISGDGTIECPINAKKILMRNGTGTVEFLSEILTDEVQMKVVSGLVSINEIEVDVAQLEVGNGELNIENGTMNTVNATVAMGNMLMNGSIEDDLKLDCGMGNVTMMLDGEMDMHNYDISGTSKTVQIGNDGLSGIAMERIIDNNAQSDFSITCAMGSVSIDFNVE